MKRLFSRYGAITAAGIQARLSYRSGYLLVFVSSAISLLAQWFLWRAIYGGDPAAVLGGFSFVEMTSYLLVTQLVFQLIDNRVEHEIAADIMRGDIVISFVRPLNYTLQKFFGSLAVVVTNGLLVALPLTACGALLLGLIAPQPLHALLFAISLLLSIVLSFLINALLGAVAFVTTNIWGLQTMKTALLGIFSGYLIPLSFFGPGWQELASWLPFQSLVYTPTVLLLGKVEGFAPVSALLLQQLLWLVILGLACAATWRAVGRQLELAGG